MVKTAAVTRVDDARVAESARDLLQSRYRRDDSLTPPGWNDTLEVLLSHRSVRAYLADPLPGGTLETLVAAAQSASSSSVS
jgi:hypothetical protein